MTKVVQGEAHEAHMFNRTLVVRVLCRAVGLIVVVWNVFGINCRGIKCHWD